MNAGDAFRARHGDHCWVVISDPEQSDTLVVVSFTTCRGTSREDLSCVVESGEHPFVRHKTYVAYGRGQSVSNRDLEKKLAAGQIQLLDPVALALLRRIRDGAMASDETPFKLQRILLDQGLVYPF